MGVRKVEVRTPDGTVEAQFYCPEGSGPWPGIILYTDILGVRPASQDMAKGFSAEGYCVLLPNLFYRESDMPIFSFQPAFGEEKTMARVGELRKSLDTEAAYKDGAAYADFLLAQPEVKKPVVGAVGYCMGGTMAIRAAGVAPDKIGAVASFHAGNLVTDAPDSPHLLAPKIKARLLFGWAVEDRTMPSEAIEKLKSALDAAGVRYEGEVYEGARHGWTMRDHHVYNQAQAMRAWTKTVAFFKDALK